MKHVLIFLVGLLLGVLAGYWVTKQVLKPEVIRHVEIIENKEKLDSLQNIIKVLEEKNYTNSLEISKLQSRLQTLRKNYNDLRGQIDTSVSLDSLLNSIVCGK
jgi:uncharacterized membrane protein YraQ (UPF0718 family)